MLEIRDLEAGYGKSKVLKGVALEVDAGERVVLLGRNGMGKSTLAKTVVGLLPTWSGSVRLRKNEISKWASYRRTWEGIGYVPQGRGLFPLLSVEENLRIGTHGARPRIKSIPNAVFEHFPVLAERRSQAAGTLSGGEQQQLAIGRALVGEPSVLILDEPSEGIQPNLVASIADRLKALAIEEGISILLIEQNIDAALRFAERCVFVENGQVLHRCGIDELRDEALVDRLLGV